jgi:hypothetical protein
VRFDPWMEARRLSCSLRLTAIITHYGLTQRIHCE